MLGLSSLNVFAQLLSLGLTATTLMMFWHVMRKFGPALWQEMNKPGRMHSYGWMIAGVYLGFVGGFVDNLYWSAPWGLSFFDHPVAADLHENGVFPNIVFRQGLGIISAYCHIRAAQIDDAGKGIEISNRILAAAMLLGLATISVLSLIRWAI